MDVFYDYRYTDEVSFGGGEFVIVRCNDEQTWELLRGKGHVVGKNGKYACIYWPYHFLGVETKARHSRLRDIITQSRMSHLSSTRRTRSLPECFRSICSTGQR